MTDEEILCLDDRKKRIFNQRLDMLDANQSERCPENKFIKFSPKVDGRITNCKLASLD